jgi:predicted PurR-regulated permease PerM
MMTAEPLQGIGPAPEREGRAHATGATATQPPAAVSLAGDLPAAEGTPAPAVVPRGTRAANRALTGLFILLLLYSAHIAAPVFVPLTVALLLALLLSPPVRGLTRVGLPAPAAAGLVVLLFLGVLGSGFYVLSSPAADWLEAMPQTMKKLERKLEAIKGPIEEMSAATARVEELARLEDATRARASEVEIRQPGFLRLTLKSTPPALVSIAVTFVLLYFMLASGREIVRKLSRRQEGSPWNRRQVIGIVRAVESDMSRYLVTVSVINAALGVAAALLLYAFGLPNAVLWGVVIAVLNYAPYVGATISTGLLALMAFLHFDSVGQALMVPAAFMAIAFVEGQVVTPSIVGRRLSLSPLLVFLAVVAFGWLWGAIGALIAVPILACVKIVCQHVPRWGKIAELLGR